MKTQSKKTDKYSGILKRKSPSSFYDSSLVGFLKSNEVRLSAIGMKK